jgi:hypothetical protein
MMIASAQFNGAGLESAVQVHHATSLCYVVPPATIASTSRADIEVSSIPSSNCLVVTFLLL